MYWELNKIQIFRVGNRKNHRLAGKTGLPSGSGVTQPFPVPLTLPKTPVCESSGARSCTGNCQTPHAHRPTAAPPARPGQPPGFSGDGWGLPSGSGLAEPIPYHTAWVSSGSATTPKNSTSTGAMSRRRVGKYYLFKSQNRYARNNTCSPAGHILHHPF